MTPKPTIFGNFRVLNLDKFDFSGQPKLISRKFWVAEQFSNFTNTKKEKRNTLNCLFSNFFSKNIVFTFFFCQKVCETISIISPLCCVSKFFGNSDNFGQITGPKNVYNDLQNDLAQYYLCALILP